MDDTASPTGSTSHRSAAAIGLSILLAVLLSACSSGGGGGGGDSERRDDPPPPASFRFSVEPQVAEAFPGWDRTVTAFYTDALGALNNGDNLFDGQTVPVIYALCGTANAFYAVEDDLIVLCDELYDLAFASFLDLLGATTDAQRDTAGAIALDAMAFVLYHEIGHALDDIIDITVPGNFESVADAIATVIAVESGKPLAAIAAGLFFGESEEASFVDVHSAGTDRAGDVLCWGTGGSPASASLLPTLVEQFVAGGRDCVGEYANQLAFVETIVPQFARLAIVSRARTQPSIVDAHSLDRAAAHLVTR